MKAKSSKAKMPAVRTTKRAPGKSAKQGGAKAAGAKKKPIALAKKPTPLKPAGKPGAKGPGRAAGKPSKESRLVKPLAKAPPAVAKPKPPARRVPKPASIATRRKERAHFRDLLLKKRQDLMRAYAISKGDSQAELDNGTEDYVDYAVNSYAREFLLSLTELDRKHLLLVEEALNRIDRGEYGYCQQCGEDIALKRLEVQPWARHCVRCQELEEKGLLPQFPFHVGEDEEPADEPEDVPPIDEEVEPEVEDEVLDDDPLVVDGDDSDE
jgi:DnaK suppressor protein